ncbi:MAG: CRISPR-associated endonuclease Cas3'', partial [Syntrophomonadaceae bacterium]|nr:CRISPR-associated endonuclease Cas3'' [Syntrophomonadaceae bacterium]
MKVMQMYYARLDRDKGIRQGLGNHLKGVAQWAQDSISESICFNPFSYTTLTDLCYWMDYFHDLGKYTSYFQQYLQYDQDSEYKNHAHISALYLYSFLQDRLKIKDFKTEENVLAFLAYLCVRFHHGSLSLNGLFTESNQARMLRELQHQVEDLQGKIPEILKDTELEKVICPEDFLRYGNIQNWKNNSKLHLMHQYILSRLKGEKWFFILIYLFSLLIDADKMDSAELKKEKIRLLKRTAVEDYLQEITTGSLEATKKINDFTDKRQAVRQTIINVLENLSDEEIAGQYFFTLTAPTGTGKTLAALEAAIRLQH